MSTSVPTIDNTQAAGDSEAAPLDDSGAPGGLAALRAELDKIDDAMQDLLVRRRAEIVEHVARSGKPAAFREGTTSGNHSGDRIAELRSGSQDQIPAERIADEDGARTRSAGSRYDAADCGCEIKRFIAAFAVPG